MIALIAFGDRHFMASAGPYAAGGRFWYPLAMVVAWLLLTTPIDCASAAEICKTVDNDGNITFSDCDKAASEATRIEVEEGPTQAEILEAIKQAQREIEDFNQLTGAPDSPPGSSGPSRTSAATASPRPASGTKTSMSRRERDATQIALDEQCQLAREKILSVERAQLVEECVQGRSRRTREECERFYADHGNATAGGRAPLYMDLPACVEAHEFRQSRSR